MKHSLSSDEQYQLLHQQWSKACAAWTDQHVSAANSTLVFTVKDPDGQGVPDCVIAIFDKDQLGPSSNATSTDQTAITARVRAMNAASPCVLPHSPIQSDGEPGSYAFYLNYGEYIKSTAHWFHAEVNAGPAASDYPYKPLTFTQPQSLPRTLSPNETTYVSLQMARNSNMSYNFYALSDDLDATKWKPFPETGRLAPPVNNAPDNGQNIEP